MGGQYPERRIPQNEVIVPRTYLLRPPICPSLGSVKIRVGLYVSPLTLIHRIKLVHARQEEINWIAVYNIYSDVQFSAPKENCNSAPSTN